MNLSDVEMGTKLELELFDNNGERSKTILISEFEWLDGINAAAIAAPIFEGNIVPLPLESVMNIYFLKRKGGMIDLYRFNAVVKGRDITENIHILMIEKQGEIEKVQRRNYFRMECYIEVRYRVFDNNNTENNKDKPFKKTMANNLSGGGICLMLDEKIEVGSLLECEMFSEQYKKFQFFGKVVRYDQIEREGKYKYEAGVAYLEINEYDRETVVKYIFDEQRKLLRKGLISHG